jgi:hypothetical protein
MMPLLVAALILGVAASALAQQPAQKPDAPAQKDKPSTVDVRPAPSKPVYTPDVMRRRVVPAPAPAPVPLPVRIQYQMLIDTPIPAPWQPPSRRLEAGPAPRDTAPR